MKKIALLGYGKMGQTIEPLAIDRGHEVVLKITAQNSSDLTSEAIRMADVAIDFSIPDTAFDHIKLCLENGVPVVSGTTAWLDQLPDAKALCTKHQGAFLYASNFSIGVNIFFAVNRILAGYMSGHPQYEVQMEETHHTQKLDAPSGTAITLAEDIIAQLPGKDSWRNSTPESPTELPIFSFREGAVPGTHKVSYQSEVDSIRIEHEAHSRQGFAMGALLAAEWIIGKTGFFEMNDFLGFK
jgi:4-hydroxy-tetrahydrodipicolinate reductase